MRLLLSLSGRFGFAMGMRTNQIQDRRLGQILVTVFSDLRRLVTITIILVVGALLISRIVGNDKQTHNDVEKSDVPQLQAPSSELVVEPIIESAIDVVEEYEDSPELADEDIGDSLELSAEGKDSAQARAEILHIMFVRNTRTFSQQLEAHYVASDSDDEWSPNATTVLTDLFQDHVDGDGAVVDCAADICIIDFFGSFEDYLRITSVRSRQWMESGSESFMRASFHFKNQDASYRFYFFRDTFDPDSL